MIIIPAIKLTAPQFEAMKMIRNGQHPSMKGWSKIRTALKAKGLIDCVLTPMPYGGSIGHFILTPIGHAELAIHEGLWN